MDTAAEFDFDTFFHSFLTTALWSSTDDSDRPLDEDYEVEDFAPETLASLRKDCEDFVEQFRADILGKEEAAGHDFWLTRNRHGAGFWDGNWPDEVGRKLTEGSHAYGEVNLYAHKGQVHGM